MTYRNRNAHHVSATELDDEDLLALPPDDRERALAELAKQGTLLAAVVVDIGAPCPGACEGTGRVALEDGTRVDCHTCDGTGVIDGRPVCHVDGCLDHGRPLRPSLTGWECARVHGHGAPPAPGHLEEPVGPGLSGALMSDADQEAELRRAGWHNSEPYGWRHPLSGTYHATPDAHAILRAAKELREAWPGVLGVRCASCGGTGFIDAPMQYDIDGSPCDGPRECGACQGKGR